jgi:murein DD-endopeptidase MepM/ murein hydrolase activator NlpD
MPEINVLLPVEALYPDYTIPPGEETKNYDTIPDDEENGTTEPFEVKGEVIKDPAAIIKEKAVADEKAKQAFLDDPLGIQAIALLSEKEYEKRQKIFNPKLHKDARKLDLGKPSNNNEPYPIDKKIVELEMHEPKLAYKQVGPLEIISSLIQLSNAAEKRVSQLENVTATMLRYLFRMSSRVQVNCVHYGGQDTFQKYNCIRCLHTDHVNDGQSMSMDQCLNCSRYEPIIGQIYDILDGEGQNLAAILDDNQMAYMNMEDHIKLSRLEEMHTEVPMADLKKEGVIPKLLAETWGEGNKMDWTETPIGSQMPRVGSYQYGKGPAYDAAALVTSTMADVAAVETIASSSTGDFTGVFDVANAMNPEFHGAVTSSNAKIQKWINNARNYAKNNIGHGIDNMIKHGYKDILVSKSKEAGVDPYLTLALIITESTGDPNSNKNNSLSYKGLMQVHKTVQNAFDPATNITAGLQMYNSKAKSIKTTNPMFVTIAYNSGEGLLIGAKSYGASSIMPSNRNAEIRWADFVLAVEKQTANHFASHGWSVDEKCEYFLRVMYCYNYAIEEIKKRVIVFYTPPSTQVAAGGVTKYDGALRMPFSLADLPSIYFTSDFGPRKAPTTGASTMHKGIDLAPSNERKAKGDVYILAAADGIVTLAAWSGSGGNTVCIQHTNGYSTTYCHCKENSIVVKQGAKVVAGQRIATVGNTGIGTGAHLHFGVKSSKSGEYIDPKTTLKNLNGKLGKSL